MDILTEYIELANSNQWEKALPLIEIIVSSNPAIKTSWYNYGVCLEALGRYNDAVKSFFSAYQLDENDYGAQYRIFRCLALAKDEEGFSEFLDEELDKTPEIIALLGEEKLFSEILSTPKVMAVIEDFFDVE